MALATEMFIEIAFASINRQSLFGNHKLKSLNLVQRITYDLIQRDDCECFVEFSASGKNISHD